jgi:hypothetical protein
MFALVGSVSMWNGTGSQLVSCPKQESLYFGIMDVDVLTDELAVRSSDGSLPDPKTRGNNSVADVIANLKYTNNFTKKDIVTGPLTAPVGRLRQHTVHVL